MLLCDMVKSLKNKRNPEVLAGMFLIFGGLIIGASFLTKIDFISLFSSLSDDFEYLTENTYVLEANSILWIASAIFIVIFSASMLVAMKVHNELLAFITAFFFLLTALLLLLAGLKGLNAIELLSYLESKVLDPSETGFIKSNILSITKERITYTRLASTLAGSGLLFLAFFGMQSRRIPFITLTLCLTGGLILTVASIFFRDTILYESGVIVFLLAIVLLGIRLTFKGFIRKVKNAASKKNEQV